MSINLDFVKVENHMGFDRQRRYSQCKSRYGRIILTQFLIIHFNLELKSGRIIKPSRLRLFSISMEDLCEINKANHSYRYIFLLLLMNCRGLDLN